MIIMHPHRVARGRMLQNHIAKAFIHPLIRFPFLPVEAGELAEVVEERPERGVAKSVVVLIDVVLRQKKRDAAMLSEQAPLCFLSLLPRELFARHPRPSDPFAVARL